MIVNEKIAIDHGLNKDEYKTEEMYKKPLANLVIEDYKIIGSQ